VTGKSTLVVTSRLRAPEKSIADRSTASASVTFGYGMTTEAMGRAESLARTLLTRAAGIHNASCTSRIPRWSHWVQVLGHPRAPPSRRHRRPREWRESGAFPSVVKAELFGAILCEGRFGLCLATSLSCVPSPSAFAFSRGLVSRLPIVANVSSCTRRAC